MVSNIERIKNIILLYRSETKNVMATDNSVIFLIKSDLKKSMNILHAAQYGLIQCRITIVLQS